MAEASKAAKTEKAIKENEKQTSKKIITLKQTTDSEKSENDDDEEITLFTRKFKRFIKNRKFQKKGRFPEKTKDQDETPPCFKCNKPGHLKRDCPLLKMKIFRKESKKSKKKALQATWDVSDSFSDEESSSDNERANMCFMTQENVSLSQSEDMEELLDAFKELYDQYKHLKLTSKNLNQRNVSLKEAVFARKAMKYGRFVSFEEMQRMFGCH